MEVHVVLSDLYAALLTLFLASLGAVALVALARRERRRASEGEE